MQPASIPAFRSSPVFCGDKSNNKWANGTTHISGHGEKCEQCSSAEWNLEDEILMVPGHIIPTEKPHTTQPIRFKRGYGARAAAR